MKTIVVTTLLCTFPLFSMKYDQPMHTPEEIQRIWYCQQMKIMRHLINIKNLPPQEYSLYILQRTKDTEVINNRDGEILQR